MNFLFNAKQPQRSVASFSAGESVLTAESWHVMQVYDTHATSVIVTVCHYYVLQWSEEACVYGGQ